MVWNNVPLVAKGCAVSKNTNETVWVPTWAQAVTDFRGEDDEPPFDNVTVRMTVPTSVGGRAIRLELSNLFGDGPVPIGRAAIGIAGRMHDASFNRQPSTEIPPGASRWTDPVELTVGHGDEIVIDLYLPEPTGYATAAGFSFERSTPGDHIGSVNFPLEDSTAEAIDESREFPAANTVDDGPEDGTGWSLPPGGPFVRTVEVFTAEPQAVVVCLGSSSTAMGWPQEAAALLSADARIAILNRGIPGNRIRLGAPEQTPSWGRAGLARFDDDVLGTAGVTHVAIAYNSNDWGLPGRVTPSTEMPDLGEMIEAYEQLIGRAGAAGIVVILGTITPLDPELAADAEREGIRMGLNDWIRASGHPVADFDLAIRSSADPSRLDPRYAAPDDTHPNVNGEKRMAAVFLEALSPLIRVR